MTRAFQILAVVLIGVTAFFFWKQNADWAFAGAVLAACSFFLSLRSQFKARIAKKGSSPQIPEDQPGHNTPVK